MKKKQIVGYTTGIYDLFHVGHLNILKNAKSTCDYLIVGVTSDELAEKLKGRKPVIPLNERMEIIESIRYVDKVVIQHAIDEIGDFHKLHFNVIVKGSDWKGTPKWMKLEEEFKDLGVKVLFFTYTKNTSSTILRNVLEKI